MYLLRRVLQYLQPRLVFAASCRPFSLVCLAHSTVASRLPYCVRLGMRSHDWEAAKEEGQCGNASGL